MILSGKGLTKAMKDSFRAGGYQALIESERIILAGNMWTVRCTTKNFPADAMALIVKHLGVLPEKDGCYKIHKDATQGAMADMVLDSLRNLEEGAPLFGDQIKKTPLTWKCADIWQREKDLGLIRMDPTITSIVAGMAIEDAVCSTDGRYIGVYGEQSAAFIYGNVTHDDDQKIMQYLGGFQWV